MVREIETTANDEKDLDDFDASSKINNESSTNGRQQKPSSFRMQVEFDMNSSDFLYSFEILLAHSNPF